MDRLDYYFLLDWFAKEDWWKGLDSKKVTLVTAPAAPPTVVDAFPNRLYFSGAVGHINEKAEEPWKDCGYLAQGLHATVSVMHLAYRMGCKRIVFTGHDYACTGGYYHWDSRLPMNTAFKEKM